MATELRIAGVPIMAPVHAALVTSELVFALHCVAPSGEIRDGEGCGPGSHWDLRKKCILVPKGHRACGSTSTGGGNRGRKGHPSSPNHRNGRSQSHRADLGMDSLDQSYRASGVGGVAAVTDIDEVGAGGQIGRGCRRDAIDE